MTETSDLLSANKRLVADFCAAFYDAKDFDRAVTFLAEGFHNHHRGAGVGPMRTVDSFREQVADRFPEFSLEIRKAVAEGDFVWTYSLIRLAAGAPSAVSVDIWRIAEGRIVEKWDVGQGIEEGTAAADLL
ncbi:nuclear transport factor 2 family protein [Actinokineospora iranica]|uniref:Predicted SnoaL-like aldol condensation-catalyzing enzyme n=1 Tax=Actinokineospora iranica TaxID=1271860 RepID=A0A1G6S720_9PSEU|nr:ester cyclase [Actinokineospora iranica]SDD11986.1 Predicted SnoaL-like aldol condensation-catalyzing enzyme [Actinokineospora iranica]